LRALHKITTKKPAHRNHFSPTSTFTMAQAFSNKEYDPEVVMPFLDRCSNTLHDFYVLLSETENFDFAASKGLLNSRPQLAANKLMTAPYPKLQELGSRYYRRIEQKHPSYAHVGRLLDPEAQRDGRPIEVDNYDEHFGKRFNTFKKNEIVSTLLKKKMNALVGSLP
jgi:hypothetical protein